MLLVTNFNRFPPEWPSAHGSGRSVYAGGVSSFLEHRRNPEAVFLVNCDPLLTCRLAAALLTGPRRPLVSADIVLRAPDTWRAWLRYPAVRMLLGRVDHFIHYFRDLRGLERVFGIGPGRSSFVPFKVNLAGRHGLAPRPDGEYILAFGKSMRDYETFLRAMETLPYPAAIVRPDPEELRRHHGRFTRPLDRLPPNLKLLDDDRTVASEIRILSGAKMVVLPIRKASLVASGIGTALNAMFLGKCVIGSEGPGMSDVFTHEIVAFPAGDPAALAAAIGRVWNDDGLRRATAEAGRRYAVSVGAEPELYRRIIEDVAGWYRGRAF